MTRIGQTRDLRDLIERQGKGRLTAKDLGLTGPLRIEVGGRSERIGVSEAFIRKDDQSVPLYQYEREVRTD